MSSLEPYLAVAARKLVPVFARQAEIDGLRGIVLDLPAVLRTLFECRLGGGERGVDLSVCVRRSEVLRDRRLEAWATGATPAPVSAALAALCDGWRNPSSPASLHVGRAWLELDVPEGARRCASAALFLGLSGPACAREDGPAAVGEVLSTLPIETAADRPSIERVFSALPAGARVSFVGAWAGREAPSLRINIVGLEAPALPSYLADLGWEDARGLLASVAATLSGCGARPVLCVDVGPALLPRIGVEAMMESAPLDGSVWTPLLDALVDGGLCLAAERDAVLGWGGVSDPKADAWPLDLIVEAVLRGPSKTPLIVRHVNHLKMALTPEAVLGAKAYLGLTTMSADVGEKRAGDVRSED